MANIIFSKKSTTSTIDGDTVTSGKTTADTYSITTIDHSKLKNRDLPDQHPIEAISGLTESLTNVDEKIAQAKEELEAEIDSTNTKINTHKNDVNNPHQVTKEQVGLGLVENKVIDELPTVGSDNYVSSGGVASYVDEQIVALAAYYITKNVKGDSFNSYSELINATTYYSGGIERIPSRNDFAIVLNDETHENICTRYSYQVNQWEYQYSISTSALTQKQLIAINSGITAELVNTISENAETLDSITNGTIIDSFREAETEIAKKQDKLVSKGNIKTINNISLLGSGNIDLDTGSGIIDIHSQYIRITNLNTGVYKLVYSGQKYLYYNGATSGDSYTIDNEDDVLLYVTTDGNGYFYWHYFVDDITSKTTKLIFGNTTLESGNFIIKNLEHIPDSALATVASTGDYTDLENLPDLSIYELAENAFSGDYNDLENKPDIPNAVSDLTNDMGYLINSDLAPYTTYSWIAEQHFSTFDGNYNSLSNKPDLSIYAETANLAPVATTGQYIDIVGKPDLSVYALKAEQFSGSYNDLTNKPFIPMATSELTNDAGFLQSADLNNYATKSWVGLQGFSTFSGDYRDLNNTPDLTIYETKAEAFSGNYADLAGKPIIPTSTNQLINNSGFITDSALAGYATESYVRNQGYITGITSSDVTTALGYTPGTSNFSGNYADLTNKPELFSGSYTDLSNKPDLTVYETKAEAFSGDYNDLSNTPEIPTEESLGITEIKAVIPNEATVSNKLADKQFVVDSINNIAAYYITKNSNGDAFDTRDELINAAQYYSGGAVRVPTRNDFAIVLQDETKDNLSTRYSYQGSQWEFQYTLTGSTMTSAQLDALNSGVNATKVATYDAYDARITAAANAASTASTTATAALNTANSAYKKPQTGIPVSDLTSTVQASLDKADNSVQQVSGKGLSTNDFDTGYKNAVDDLINNRSDFFNQKPDWNAESGPTEILNKPNLATVATSGSFYSLIDAPNLADVATSGNYNDLTNKLAIEAGTGIAIADTSATANGRTTITKTISAVGLSYLAIAPEADNPNQGEVKIVILSSEPPAKYSGYLYFICDSTND